MKLKKSLGYAIISAILTLTCNQTPLDPFLTAPTNFTYPQTDILIYKGVAMPTQNPDWIGFADKFSSEPPLPTGFLLDQVYGVISGKSDDTLGKKSYLIKAVNSKTDDFDTLTMSILVIDSPSIKLQPTSVSNLIAGNSASFSIQALGTGLVYQWNHDVLPIPAATSASYIINQTTLADSGSYYCRVTDTLGTVLISDTARCSLVANPAKSLTEFGFASFSATGVIDETAKTIRVTLPFGTNVTELIATFSTTGTSVKIGSTPQNSGTTPNNFSSPVTYTITAADNTTQNYIVIVSTAASSLKALTSFGFTNPAATGIINESAKTVAITVPFGTNITALAATFSTTGASVKVAGTTQTSGSTVLNFTNPATYTITAADGTSQVYVVTVTVAINSAKAFTSFSLANPAATGSINLSTKTISVNVPFGTNITALVATFSTTGASVKVGSIVQVSGTTINNFSNPVIYAVTAADGSVDNYVVTVTIAANSAKAITAFCFSNPAATGVINVTSKTIVVNVPFGTDVTALVASFATTGASVKVGAILQDSGTTANNFSSPITYTVTASDGSNENYLVTVIVAPSNSKDLTGFSFADPAATGIINNTSRTVSIVVPNGANVSALIASFTSTGASVKVGSVTQVSGTTPHNFSGPVIYTIVAADGTTKDYEVTVLVGPPPPILTAPADAAFGLTVSPILSWDSVSTAVTYHVQVSSSNSFASVIVEDSALTKMTKTPGSLTNGSTYYWRVRAKNTIGVSNWSTIRSFRTIKQFALNITAANGTISRSLDLTQYDSGAVVTITPNPAVGYRFTGWSGDLSGAANPATVTMTGIKNITANFAIKQYVLNFSSSADVGTVSGTIIANPSQSLYDSGTTIRLTAPTTDVKYNFVNWSAGGGAIGTANPLSVVICSDTTVTANYAIKKYTLAVTVSPVGGGSVVANPATGPYNYGTSILLTATPSAGFQPTVVWSDDAGGTNLSTSVTMDNNKAVICTFTPTPPTISTHPSNQTVFLGDTATFTVVATGQTTLSYQWQMDNNPISGATSSTYKMKTDTTFNGKGFKCVVTTSVNGITTSNDATLTVTNTFVYNGDTYHAVKIGNQVWMSENLKTTKYRDGTAIIKDTSTATWGTFTASADSGKYCWYSNDSATNKNPYGALYNWHVVKPTNPKYIAPSGWHVPTDAEWTMLSTYLGGESVAGGKMKEAGITHWASPNTNATNSSGFSGLPGGYRAYNGYFLYRDFCYLWSTTESDESCCAYGRGLGYNISNLARYYDGKSSGISVRLLRD